MNTTITGNVALTFGGGIVALALPAAVRNTIGAGNQAPSNAEGWGSTPTDRNLVGLNGLAGISSILDPTLAPNGGPTLTHALAAGSPAIDAGTNSGCPATDQRGVARAQGAACDIGSYEYNCTDLDIDDNARCDALTDGLLAVRYLFGLTGDGLIIHAIGAGAMRADSDAVTAYLSGIRAKLDIDGSGASDAATDGLLILRYLSGLRGSGLIAGISLGSRNNATAVEAYFRSLLP